MDAHGDAFSERCRCIANEWLRSEDLLIRDMGARVLAALDEVCIRLSRGHSELVPPGDMAGDFSDYRWGPMPLRVPATCRSKTNIPFREFNVCNKDGHDEVFGMRLGMVWAAPGTRYPMHPCASIQLLYQLKGNMNYFTEDDSVHLLSPGTTCLKYGPQHGSSNIGPSLTLYVERLCVSIPCVLREVRAIAADPVMDQLRDATFAWLQDAEARPFARELMQLLKPRGFVEPEPDWVRGEAAVPPLCSAGFKACNWFKCESLDDPDLCEMLETVFFKTESAMFGLFWVPPGVWYPPHAHGPKEVYHLLEGRARLYVTEDPRIDFGPGEFRVHQSGQEHGMQTLEDHALILWGWMGNLQSHDYRMIDDDIFMHLKIPWPPAKELVPRLIGA